MKIFLIVFAVVAVLAAALAIVPSLFVFDALNESAKSGRQPTAVTRSDLGQLKRGMKEKEILQKIGKYDRTIWISGKNEQELRCLAYTYEISEEKGIAGKLGLDDSAYLLCLDARSGKLVEMKDRRGVSKEKPISFSAASPKTEKPAKAS